MDDHRLHIFTVNNQANAQCLFRQGVPLPRGKFSANSIFCLENDDKKRISCTTKILGLWPDKSVRWLLVEGCLALSTGTETKVYLCSSEYTNLSIKAKWVENVENHILLNLSNTKLTVSKTEFFVLSSDHLLNQASYQLQLKDSELKLRQLEIDTEYEATFDNDFAPLFCDIKQSASFIIESDESCQQVDSKKTSTINAEVRLRVFYASGAVEVKLVLHNPQPLAHHGGKWDLGNENSIFIQDCALSFDLSQADDLKAALQAKQHIAIAESEAKKFQSLTLIQHSSGGKNWNSPNHKQSDNKVHLQKRETTVLVDDNNHEEIGIRRAEPVFIVSSKTQKSPARQRFVIKPERFWQKFPASVLADSKNVTLHYIDTLQGSSLNNNQPALLELQPGEQFCQDVLLVLQETNTNDTTNLNVLLEPTSISLSSVLIEESNVIPWYVASYQTDPLQALINAGLAGESSFLEKREALDEYGWRNFGDIYADHEAANQSDSSPFVSHYNNQYDPLYGFLKQWLLSGNHQWKMLADDLFEHIVHVDIYHTEFDKPEYNNGLFWHTDHYAQAETATHRTYSKHQPSDVYQDHAGGGGPGSHHCYTSGLTLYYWLSGNKRAFECMFKLTDWMRYIYEGDGTLLGQILRVKNANYLTLPFTDKLVLGSGTGVVRNIFTNTYPLDRGTGNYVNAVLDAYEISQDQKYLSAAEGIILKTISHADDIALRNLDDIENTWFYVIFLQSIAKYLFFVSSENYRPKEPRTCTAQIRETFLHYAEYMLHNEQPYLNQKHKLEYPNDTWSAQDLRKVQVLVIAAMFSPQNNKDKFIIKAQDLNEWIVKRLTYSEERAYARLLTLMMQNYGSLKLLGSNQEKQIVHPKITEKGVVNMSTWSRVKRFIYNYSFKRERKHLVQRIPTLQKYFGKP